MNHATTTVPRRPLGRTGFQAALLGIGDLADRSLPLETCVATLRRAIDAGLNLVDTAPGYEEGYSEEIVAQAVKGVRDQLFVIDKIDDLQAPVAPQIEASLRRLQLDHTDAFVFHALSSLEIFERLAAPGGGFDQLADCIRAGKTRFGGISSHNPDVLQAAIEARAVRHCHVPGRPVCGRALHRRDAAAGEAAWRGHGLLQDVWGG